MPAAITLTHYHRLPAHKSALEVGRYGYAGGIDWRAPHPADVHPIHTSWGVLLMEPQTNQYLEAKRVALAAVELVGDQREEFIAAECASDAEMVGEVCWMLQAMESTHTAPLPALSTVSPDISGQEVQATAARHYRLIRRLGEGGMGTVYLAERCDVDFTQHVALKVLTSAEAGSPILAERFHQESRLHGRLEHPNIARLLDGGALADGRPFLAIEYVQGERIDVWCNRRELDLTARITLFLKVCIAVDYAHQHLIIHRDIKPANILVTEDGTPKLLDFGIARQVDDQSDVLDPAAAANAMTLAYASPEQIERRPLTIAADVYSLGVVLYQLVAGRRPHHNLSTPQQLSNAIASGEVVPPSRARRLLQQEAGQERQRAYGVPRDVDAIVLKAMQRTVDERYPDVVAFSTDLQRFLEHRPVQARRGWQWARVRRFVQRPSGWLMACVAMVLLGGLLAALMALQRSGDAQRLAEQRQHQLERIVRNQQCMLDHVDAYTTGHVISAASRQGADAR